MQATACFKNGLGNREVIPQGLKPLVNSALFGTTEVVPFQNIDLFRASLELQLYFLQISTEAQGPGLKALSICRVFRGLKPPAPSGIFDLQL